MDGGLVGSYLLSLGFFKAGVSALQKQERGQFCRAGDPLYTAGVILPGWISSTGQPERSHAPRATSTQRVLKGSI